MALKSSFLVCLQIYDHLNAFFLLLSRKFNTQKKFSPTHSVLSSAIECAEDTPKLLDVAYTTISR